MKPFKWPAFFRSLVTFLCVLLITVPGDVWAYASSQAQTQTSAATPASPQASPATQATRTPPDQLDSLVAPIALYPDPVLAQVLAASTYPLEIVQLQQWLAKNKTLKDKALADAVSKQPWDPSIQALAALPEVANRLANDIGWTTDLGNAFLAQQADVMEAVQRMRKKAQEKGNLKSTEQQKVETTVIEKKQVIIIQPASPDVVYVPTYDPVVVYGAPVYPYPPIYYPPAWYYPTGLAISFGVGMMMGAFWSGGWGWGCGWGGNNVYINNNNNFNRNSNINGGNRVSNLPGRGNNGNRAGRWKRQQAEGNGGNWSITIFPVETAAPAAIASTMIFLAEEIAATGSIIPSTAAAHPIATAPQQIDSVDRRAVILSPGASQAHASKLPGKAATCPATAPLAASETAPVARG